MDSFLIIALKAMRRQTADYSAQDLQQELNVFAQPWRAIFSIWFSAILFGGCAISLSLNLGSVLWFGVGVATLMCAVPLPYLLQHRIPLNFRWNAVPAALHPLVAEVTAFANGEHEAFLPGGDIVERSLFRSAIAILLFSENRFDRFMVMLNPIRSYSALLKATPLDEVADDSHEEAEPPSIVQTVKTIEVDRVTTGADFICAVGAFTHQYGMLPQPI
jgi:hypothetical protein